MEFGEVFAWVDESIGEKFLFYFFLNMISYALPVSV